MLFRSDERQFDNLIQWLKSLNLDVHLSSGINTTIVGLVGDTSVVDIDLIRALDIVSDVKRVQEPYKNANRKFHPDDTVIEVSGIKIGGGNRVLMAGPCSVESEDQIVEIAKRVKAAGAAFLTRRRVQAAVLAIRFSGAGKGWAGAAESRAGGNGAADCDGADDLVVAAAFRRYRRDSDRRAQHAEF